MSEQTQAAENELAELKEKMEGGLKNTPSPLRGTPPLQGESFLVGTAHPTGESVKTQGARELRGGSLRGLMERAAVRAAESGRRADLQEYLRVRRAFV